MKAYRIATVDVVRHPVVRVRYDDGFEEEMDFSEHIEAGHLFASLADPAFFTTVEVSPSGRCFGWRLSEVGREIDLCADGVRFDLEEQRVRRMADTYRQRRSAAE